MSGYLNYSMSNNAVDAYDRGERPLSKWTKEEILYEAAEIIDFLDIKINFDFEKLKKVKKSILVDNLLIYSGYHHTSKFYNKTDFYEIDEDLLKDLTNDDIDQWIIESQRIRKNNK